MAREAHYPTEVGSSHKGLSGTQRVRIHTKRNSSLNRSKPARDVRAVGLTGCGPISRRTRVLTTQAPRPIKVTALSSKNPSVHRALQ